VDKFGGEDVKDVTNLKNLIDGYKYADQNRIGMFGGSRGGLMTYLALSQVAWLKAAVVIGGVSNELNASSFRKDWREHQIRMYGGGLAEMISRSPALFTEKFPCNVPLLIIHGNVDWRVNPVDSLRLAEGLLAHRVPFRLVMWEGADHYLSEVKRESNQQTLEWFVRFVKSSTETPEVISHEK
jgi:dipeptidyl aminopeptidase/acylaminoacyl peptidase